MCHLQLNVHWLHLSSSFFFFPMKMNCTEWYKGFHRELFSIKKKDIWQYTSPVGVIFYIMFSPITPGIQFRNGTSSSSSFFPISWALLLLLLFKKEYQGTRRSYQRKNSLKELYCEHTKGNPEKTNQFVSIQKEKTNQFVCSQCPSLATFSKGTFWAIPSSIPRFSLGWPSALTPQRTACASFKAANILKDPPGCGIISFKQKDLHPPQTLCFLSNVCAIGLWIHLYKCSTVPSTNAVH